MNIHFISIDEPILKNLANLLYKKEHHISVSKEGITHPLNVKPNWFTEEISKNLDAVIVGTHTKPDHPDLIIAQELELKIYSYPEFIVELSKNKTRVVISGSHQKTTLISMLLHVLKFHQKSIDFLIEKPIDEVENLLEISDENDFIIIDGDENDSSLINSTPKFLHYNPNIALISGIFYTDSSFYKNLEEQLNAFRNFIKSITPGGILIYNEEDQNAVKLIEEAENYFRKLPYQTPHYHIKNEKVMIETELGEMKLQISTKNEVLSLEGARLAASQLGILEEEFYEAMLSFCAQS